MECTCSGKIRMIFNVPDQETARRILEEVEGMIRQKLDSVSKSKGRVLQYESSHWVAPPKDKKE